jgi:hypothetical protein
MRARSSLRSGEYNSAPALVSGAGPVLGAKREKKRWTGRRAARAAPGQVQKGGIGFPVSVRILAENPGPAGRNSYEENLPTQEAQART